MTSVRRLLNLWDQFEAQVGGLFLFISVLLVFLLIVLRSLSIGVSGLYEIATFCMIFSVMLTASLGIKRNIHVRIDILSNVVPATVGFALEIGAMLIVLIVAAYLSYSAICWSRKVCCWATAHSEPFAFRCGFLS